MGCGASKDNNAGKADAKSPDKPPAEKGGGAKGGGSPAPGKSETPPSAASPQEKKQDKAPAEMKTQPLQPQPPPPRQAEPAEPPAPAPVAAGGTADSAEPLPSRVGAMPSAVMSEVTGGDKEVYFVSACAHLGEHQGLRFAVRRDKLDGKDIHVDNDTPLYTKAFTDEELTAVRDGLPKGAEGAAVEWKSFWKMVSTAFCSSGKISVSVGGSKQPSMDIKLKQSKEPKEMTWTVELTTKESSSAAKVYEHFIQPFPRVCEHRRQTLANEAKDGAGSKDKKELREQDFVKGEAEGATRFHGWAVSESVVLAAESAERRLSDVLPELAEDAKKKRRMVAKQQNQMAKMNQQIEILRAGSASHPLDKMYCIEEPPEDCAGARSYQAPTTQIDASQLGWDTDVDDLGVDLVDIAWALFSYHGLVDYFTLDKEAFISFWMAVRAGCRENPFHCAKRAADMMCLMNYVLGRPDAAGSLINRVKMSKEDIFSALLSAGIVDLNHEGVTNAFAKRAGTMLSMLYSDLYQTDQDSLTAAFELMLNPHLNMLKSLTPEQVKDITETVREALFIKANVQMKNPTDKFEEFRQLVANSPEWAAKDNVRHAITHALRMCDLAAWGRPLELHKKWMDRVREEFYLQGDKETKLGLAPSTYHDTQWTTARERDDSDFAAGQVSFIDSVVLPLFLEMQRLVPELELCVKEAKENRAHWEQVGGVKSSHFKKALQSFGKVFTATNDGGASGMVAFARPGPDVVRPGYCLWISAVGNDGVSYVTNFDEAGLSKHGLSLQGVTDAFREGGVKSDAKGESCTLTIGAAVLSLEHRSFEETIVIFTSLKSTFELRRCERQKDIERQLDKLEQAAKTNRDKAMLLEGEARALRSCIDACDKQIEEDRGKLEETEQHLVREAGSSVPADKIQSMKKMEREDALSIKVRNPLKAPLPPGVTKPPDCRDVDKELLKLLKSRFMSKKGGVEAQLDAQECQYVNVVQPLLTSEFADLTKNIADPIREKIWNLTKKLDDWDYDVFELQTAMSGGISGECMREQPHGGALFVTMYALIYKWQFMQKFNLNEQVLLNWLSIVEAGYHPNPYHNSMHAADVLHVTHYIISEGGLQKKIRATDSEVFAALFAATVHDYNHPGINNAFHVRSQNYLAVLFNDRSVNENIHASSVFELMRMDEFNLLKAFKGQEYTNMRDDIVEFILGTDMGLHAMFVSRFKKRLELTDNKMHRAKPDRNLALTMAVKMADISNCGRPQKLYHGWCNVIVDEFFQQGDRERLQGMPVSPFMDRYTTVMSKGQIGFMNYIVMPLFECMGEYLEDMHMATVIAEENKGFWQENEDW